MSSAADRGWPVRSLSGPELGLVCTPNPTPEQLRAGVLKVAGFPGRVALPVVIPFRKLVAGLIRIRKAHGLPELICGGGNNFRPVRGYEERWLKNHDADLLSNHAFGLAIDLNAGTNPMGKPIRSDFPRAEVYALCDECGIEWGREWSRPDPMHFEFLGTPAEAKALTERLNGDDDLSAKAELLIEQMHAEMFRRFPNRTGDPNAKGSDTPAGFAINADGYGYRAERQIAELRRENAVLRDLLANLPKNVADELLNRKISATKWNGGALVTEDATVAQLLSRGSEGSIAAHLAQGEPLITGGTENV